MAKVLILISMAMLLLVGVSTVIVWRGLEVEGEIVGKWQQRELAHQLAEELRQSSDDLTRMARTYAATGDERYRRHFQEILDIRNGVAPRPENYHLVYWDLVIGEGEKPRPAGGAVPLRELMQSAGFTAEELLMLEESEDESNRLAAMENNALRVAGEGDLETAGQLLYSPGYHEAKRNIMLPILRFVQAMEGRTAEELAALRDRQKALNRYFLTTVTFLLALLAVALVIGLVAAKRNAPEANG